MKRRAVIGNTQADADGRRVRHLHARRLKPTSHRRGNDAKCGFACHTIVQAKDYVFTPYPKR